MSAARTATLVIGSLVTALGLALIVAGVALLFFHGAARDDAGFYSTDGERLATSAGAIVSEELDIQIDGPDWLFDEGRLTTVRLRASSRAARRPVFIGVGPTSRVRAYLARARHDLLTDLEIDPFRPTYRRQGRSGSLRDPGDQRFWVASARGAEARDLRWDVRDGNWSIVLMNADGAQGVDARVSIGAKVGIVRSLGLGFTIGGGILVLAGAAMIVLAARRPRDSGASPAPSA